MLESVRGSKSLTEFLSRLTVALSQSLPAVADQMNWLMLQFPSLPDKEKKIVQGRMLGIQRSVREEIGRYVSEGAEADRLAWLVIGAFLGFFQLSTKMELGESVDLSLNTFGDYLTQMICGGLNQ